MNSLTEKANQHYIPKFYLRQFSYLNNKKQIGVYNTSSGFFIHNGKLKTQASKKFFYGKDGILENFYQKLENIFAPIMMRCIREEKVPRQPSIEQMDFLNLIFTMELRNPMSIELRRKSLVEIHERVEQIDADYYSNEEKEDFKNFISNDNLHRMAISNLKDIVMLSSDLKIKLLRNNTTQPFITSDYPIVKYNQFMEKADWVKGISYNGSGWIGQQIFFPLNEKYLIFLYDPNIYKVGFKKQDTVELNDINSVNSLNILQFLNCTENIFFSHNASENYINTLHKKSAKFTKGNQTNNFEMDTILPDGSKEENSFIFSSSISNLETNLNIEKVKIHTKGRGFKFDDYAIQWRPKAKVMYNYLQSQKNN
ncbi:DUF4238 domain-containing protein [bacterium]|nr:DUF4238 domain-containing protein [bacterium]